MTSSATGATNTVKIASNAFGLDSTTSTPDGTAIVVGSGCQRIMILDNDFSEMPLANQIVNNAGSPNVYMRLLPSFPLP